MNLPKKALTKVIMLLLIFFSTGHSTKSSSDKQEGHAEGKLHIIFMMVDDWEWANVGYDCNPPTPEVVTPNIDSLVKDGLDLDQHYAYQFCSPSRSSFISGRLPIHVNDKNSGISIFNPDDPISGFAAIPCNMTGIATKLKAAGYATDHIGKWHAGGVTPDHIPTGRGFNTSFGYFNADNDYYTEVDGICSHTPIVDLWDTDKPTTGVNGTGPDNYEEALFAERLMQPLFLYYTPHIAHAPLQVPDRYVQKFSFIDDHRHQYVHAMVY